MTLQAGHLVPMRFEDMRDPDSGKTRVRYVNTDAEGYEVARRYMIRIGEHDFEDPAFVDRLAAAARLPAPELRRRFEYLADGTVPREEDS